MGALSGYRVIELAGIGPAPMCAMMLSDMGAEGSADRPHRRRRAGDRDGDEVQPAQSRAPLGGV